jgi:hypothetical protein
MKLPVPKFFLIILTVVFLFSPYALSQDVKNLRGDMNSPRPNLVKAVMCEGMRDNDPHNQGLVFSAAMGRILCFSDFETVSKKTSIYHNWFFRDRLVTRLKLTLQSPRWSGHTSIQLREADRGPWRVEVTDQEGYVFETLRFSITD